jgi:hypothetical protein
MAYAGAPNLKDEPSWVLWGTYEPATITEVQQGMQSVQFADGETRWVTVSEIIVDAPPPLEKLRVGDAVMAPTGQKRADKAPHYAQCSIVRLPELPLKPSAKASATATVQSLEGMMVGISAAEQAPSSRRVSRRGAPHHGRSSRGRCRSRSCGCRSHGARCSAPVRRSRRVTASVLCAASGQPRRWRRM